MDTDKNRRQFIKITGTVSLSLLGGASIASAKATSRDQSISQDNAYTELETSIHAHFGPGFRIIEYTLNDANIIVKIEHIENYYWVKTPDLYEWEILSSSTS